MWIKWLYNDHGCGGYKEMEVPDDVVKTYGSVENYICEMDLVPTWSERFLVGRIKWEKIDFPSVATLESEIAKLDAQMASCGSLRITYRALLETIKRRELTAKNSKSWDDWINKKT